MEQVVNHVGKARNAVGHCNTKLLESDWENFIEAMMALLNWMGDVKGVLQIHTIHFYLI